MLQPSSYEAVLRTALSENGCEDSEAWLRREKAQARLAQSKKPLAKRWENLGVLEPCSSLPCTKPCFVRGPATLQIWDRSTISRIRRAFSR